MTDKLHYLELFTTINIPEAEKTLALEAKHLFDIAHGVEQGDAAIFSHMNSRSDTENASQIFWDYENDVDYIYDRLAVTIMRKALTVAFEHRDFNDPSVGVRKSLVLSDSGWTKVYATDLQNRGRFDIGSTELFDIQTFKDDLTRTVSNLGLYTQAKLRFTPQNESSAVILPNAA